MPWSCALSTHQLEVACFSFGQELTCSLTLFIPAHQLGPFPPTSTAASTSPAFPTITQGITLFPSFPLSILPVSVTQEPLLHPTATVLDGHPSPGCERVCSNMRNTSLLFPGFQTDSLSPIELVHFLMIFPQPTPGLTLLMGPPLTLKITKTNF